LLFKVTMIRLDRFRLRWWMALGMSLLLALQLDAAGAQTQNRAGLVIQYGDGRINTYCVRFSEPSITGLDLLNRSGLKVIAEVGGQGAAMCSIGGQGCAYPTQSCFCQCQGANCAYWNYLHLIDGAWRYSPIGAAGYTIADGAIDGWAWGDKVAPPAYTIDQICSEAPAAGPTKRPLSTATTEVSVGPISSPTLRPAAAATSQPARASSTPAASPTAANRPNVTAPVQPSVEPTDPHTIAPTVAATSQPVNPPADQPADSTTDQTSAGSYVLFGIVVAAMGGWLIVTRMRQR
jgi:hypothetical protein